MRLARTIALVRGAVLILALATFTDSAHATVIAAADTYLTEHSGLGGTASNHGTDTTLWVIGSGGFQSLPLVFFDLSGFLGQTVMGPGTLTFNVASTFSGSSVTQDLAIYPVLISWGETTVTWSNFGASAGPDAGADYSSTAIDSQTATVGPGGTVIFSIAAGVLQGWINDGTTNFGLILGSSTATTQQDIVIASREFGSVAGPSLDFSTDGAVPEPATAVLCAAGLALAGIRKYISAQAG